VAGDGLASVVAIFSTTREKIPTAPERPRPIGGPPPLGASFGSPRFRRESSSNCHPSVWQILAPRGKIELLRPSPNSFIGFVRNPGDTSISDHRRPLWSLGPFAYKQGKPPAASTPSVLSAGPSMKNTKTASSAPLLPRSSATQDGRRAKLNFGCASQKVRALNKRPRRAKRVRGDSLDCGFSLILKFKRLVHREPYRPPPTVRDSSYGSASPGAAQWPSANLRAGPL